MSRPETDHVLRAIVRASSNGETGVPEQVAVAVRDDPPARATIVAIARGHAGTAARNHIGARIAADVAATKAEAAVAALPSADAATLAPLGDVLAARILEQWQAQVRGHIAIQSAAAGIDAEPDTDALSAHDAALLLAIVTPAAVLALQLGDGDIVLRSDDGETIRPLAADGRSDSPEARSLAAVNPAEAQFRHATVDRTTHDVALVLVAAASGDAAADKDWPAMLAAELQAQSSEHDADAIEEQLPARVAAAARGDGDLAVAVILPAAAEAIVPAAVTDAYLATTMAVPAVRATAATPGFATSELPAVAPATATARTGRRRWIAAAIAAAVVALAIAGVLAVSHDNGSTTPANVTPTTRKPTPSTTVRPSTSASTPNTAAPSSAPTTVPPTAPPATTVPVVVTSPPRTAAPPRTTTPTRPPPTTRPPTTPPPTTVPVTTAAPPTT